jgi:hypothetical protein
MRIGELVVGIVDEERSFDEKQTQKRCYGVRLRSCESKDSNVVLDECLRYESLRSVHWTSDKVGVMEKRSWFEDFR